MKKLFVIALSFGILTACGNKNEASSGAVESTSTEKPAAEKAPIVTDKIVHVDAPTEAKESYELYIPARAKNTQNAPTLIFFDPHGAGNIPVEKYKGLADKYGVILAGSNSSKNGQQVTDGYHIANNLIADLEARYGCDTKKMGLCGFSGGAKVALYTANNNTLINNVIYIGAAIPLNARQPLSMLGIAGVNDMNYTDLIQFAAQVESTNPANGLMEWSGKHEWADQATFQRAMQWFCFQVWRQNAMVLDLTTITEFEQDSKMQITQAKRANDPLKAYELNHTAYVALSGITDASTYKKGMDAIAQTDAYKKALADKNANLQQEANQKQVLMAAFQNQGSDWWTKVTNQYKASKNPSDKRLLGFISLASYSYANQLLQQRNLEPAKNILTIYEMADATNTDQLYFHAELYALLGNTDLSIQYLQRAIKEGFTDRQKVEAEPAFSTVKGDKRFTGLWASLPNSK
jgi:predicted esterase